MKNPVSKRSWLLSLRANKFLDERVLLGMTEVQQFNLISIIVFKISELVFLNIKLK
jgi:hypothetical protein